MDINLLFTQILYYFETQLHFLFIKYLCGLHDYIKFFDFGLKNIDNDRRDTWHRCFRRPFHTYAYCSVSLSDLLLIYSASASEHSWPIKFSSVISTLNKMSYFSKDKTFRWKNKNVSEAVYLSRKKSSDRMKRKWEEVKGNFCEESSSTKKIRLGTRLVNLDILRARILRVKLSKWCCDSEIKKRLYRRNDFPCFLSQHSNAFYHWKCGNRERCSFK